MPGKRENDPDGTSFDCLKKAKRYAVVSCGMAGSFRAFWGHGFSFRHYLINNSF